MMRQPSEPGQGLDRRLAPLADLRGVQLVAVADQDGLLVRATRSQLDPEAVAAHAPVLAATARRMAEDAGLEPSTMVLAESPDGVILVAPLSMSFTLVVVADSAAVLGSIRFVMRETVPDLNSLLARGYR